MVYRIFVEKKPGLDNEARALLGDAKKFLGIKGLEKVRLLNRYDAENISEELFNYAVKTVFSTPPSAAPKGIPSPSPVLKFPTPSPSAMASATGPSALSSTTSASPPAPSAPTTGKSSLFCRLRNYC